MLKACYKAIALVAATVGFLTPLTRATAQTTQVLVDWTSTWRWEQSGTDLGTAWRALSFPAESTWATGQGLLGFEPDAIYPAPFNTALSVPTPVTAYFRIHFNYTGPTNGATLTASNVVDDGYVMFLNGAEVSRLRVPAGQIFTTSASAGPATEGIIEVANLPAGALRNGDNVLAVEVHQSGTASSDIAWGTKLVIVAPTTVAITTQPQSQTIPLGSSVTFNVGISGGPANYQWQKDLVNLPGQTNSSYTIASVVAGSAGSYRVRVFNSLNSVTSSPAVLTVTSDISPPVPLAAVVREVTTGSGVNTSLSFTNIEITVDEPLLLATVTPTNNYKVYNYDTKQSIPVVNVLYNFPTVRLSVTTNAGSFYRSNYFVRVSGVADTRGNIMPPTDVGVSWRISTNLVKMSQNWDFFNLTFLFDPNYVVYSNYFRTNFVVDPGQGWGNGVGILWNDQDQNPPTCSTDNTLGVDCGFQFDPQLFRRTFQVPTNLPTSGTLRLQYVVDDGAVFYLNGQELHRYNMPNTALTPASKSTANISPAVCVTNVAVNVTNRVYPGMNWLAGTVYQSTGDGEGDTVFGFGMVFEYLKTSPIPPEISIRRNGAAVQVVWSGTGFTLQSSTNPANPASWANVAGATSPANAAPNTFYRLNKN